MTEQDRGFANRAWRLVPFMTLLYVVNYIDRVNVGFAALTMNKELGFSPSIYGFGAGIFFFSYALCQVPASMSIARIGPRRGISWIPLIWGALSRPTLSCGAPQASTWCGFSWASRRGIFSRHGLYQPYGSPKTTLGARLRGFRLPTRWRSLSPGPCRVCFSEWTARSR